MVALEQQKLAGDFDAYAKRLATQERMMSTKSEHKQGNLGAEVNANRTEVSACRDELARMKKEAKHKVHLVTMQLSAHLVSVEAGTRGQTQRAQRLEDQLRSAQAESDEMSASRLQQGVEA